MVLALVAALVQGISFVAAPHAAPARADASTGTAGQFVPANVRLLDTRNGTGGYSTPMPANGVRSVSVAGVSGLPSGGMSALALTLTVVGAGSIGGISVSPGDVTPNQAVAALVFNTLDSVSNTAMVALHSDGKIKVEADHVVNLIIDVQGYYTSGSGIADGGFVATTPTRIADTRSGLNVPLAKVSNGSAITVTASGLAGIPSTAGSVYVNVTAINQAANGYLRTYAAGGAIPTVGALDFDNADPMAQSAAIPLNSSGQFSVYVGAGGPVNLIIDVQGYFDDSVTSGAFTPAAVHLLDTRTTVPASTLAGNSVTTLQITGLKGIPLATSGIGAVALNLRTVLNASTTSGGYLRLWPADQAEPVTSNVNYNTDTTYRTDLAIVAPSADGTIKIRNGGSSPIEVVVDVEGWFATVTTPIPAGQDLTQERLTLQGTAPGGGSWVTYKYRVGTVASFSSVPVGNVVVPGTTTHPSAWPVQRNGGGAFDPYTWDVKDTLTAALGSAPDTLVQVEGCFGSSSSDPNPVCSMPANVQFARSAFGDSAATDSVGPGTAALLTGDYQVSATDADVASSLGSLSLGRALTTLAPAAANTTATGVFGPGWTADLSGPDAGDASLTVNDQSSLGYLVFAGTDASASVYQTTGSLSTYPISFVGVDDAAGDGTTVTKDSATQISMIDPDNTKTVWTKSGSTWRVSSVSQPGSSSTSAYSYNAAGLVTRILGPVPAGVSCTNPDTTPGCRSLTLTYATVAGVQRLTAINYVAYDPAISAMHSVGVAAYDYDSSARLSHAWDPRISPALNTTYTYDTNNRLATLTPPGQAMWSFGYDSSVRLITVSHPDTANSATATTTLVYGVPFTGTGAPVDLSAAATATWAESSDLPTTGTAIFPADHNPAGTTAATVTTTDWPYATINYLDTNGREVNTAQYGAGGWQLDTTQYDQNGNDVWDLSAGNRAQALTPTSSTDGYVAGLTDTTARANLLSSTTIYNPIDTSQVTDSFSPTHPITLTSGTVIDARTHVAASYDEGAPNSDVDPATGGGYGLATTVVSDPYNVQTLADTGYPDASTTRTRYDPVVSGDTSGWTLHQATSSTVQMGSSQSGSNDLTSYTRYNAAGQSTETRLPGDANGTGPRTTQTTYYTASGSGGCVSAAQAGLVCSSAPAAQPSSGKPLPVISYAYNLYGDTLTKTETYGTGGSQDVRTTTNSYDTADRPATSGLSVSPTSAGGTAVPTVTYGYDTGTGLPTTSSTGSGAGTVTLTTGYNNLGEATTYTDATGNTATTTYDIDGNTATINDGKATTSYTYNSSSEHRGLVTSEDVGITASPSTFSASYDAAGNLATETYPNGLTAATTYDNAGNATKLTYAKSGSTWMTFTATNGDGDRTVAQTSPTSSQTFSYDQADRLTAVQDTYTSTCTTRTYDYDYDSNRTALNSYPPTTGGACSTSTTPSVAATSFDQADRDTNSGYVYDDLGRTTTVPAADAQGIGSHAATTGNVTVGYDSNDMVASQTQGTSTVTFTLDPLQNRINTSSDATTTTTNHYSDGTDGSAWTSTSSSVWTRDLTGPDGNLAATVDQAGTVTLQLPNLHGDTVATCADDTAATAIANYSESTEYGAPRTAATAYDTYGWLGTKQRSSNDLAGLMIMGVRLYDSATGRFESPDPIAGGNANAYIYPTDPVDGSDPSGRSKDHVFPGEWHLREAGFNFECEKWICSASVRNVYDAAWKLLGYLTNNLNVPVNTQSSYKGIQLLGTGRWGHGTYGIRQSEDHQETVDVNVRRKSGERYRIRFHFNTITVDGVHLGPPGGRPVTA